MFIVHAINDKYAYTLSPYPMLVHVTMQNHKRFVTVGFMHSLQIGTLVQHNFFFKIYFLSLSNDQQPLHPSLSADFQLVVG